MKQFTASFLILVMCLVILAYSEFNPFTSPNGNLYEDDASWDNHDNEWFELLNGDRFDPGDDDPRDSWDYNWAPATPRTNSPHKFYSYYDEDWEDIDMSPIYTNVVYIFDAENVSCTIFGPDSYHSSNTIANVTIKAGPVPDRRGHGPADNYVTLRLVASPASPVLT